MASRNSLPHSCNVKLCHNDHHCGHRKTVSSAKQQRDKGVKQHHQPAGQVSGHDKEHKIHFLVDFIQPVRIFHYCKIADTAGKSHSKFSHQVVQCIDHQPVIGVKAHRRKANKGGHQQTVRIAHDDG